jgi:exodeoxyribonuclease VII small subunit
VSPARKERSKTHPPSPGGEAETTFEAALARLEELVGRLEDGEVPLEESLAAYAEGTRLVRRCLDRLAAAEAMIRELSEGPEGFRLEASALEEPEEDDAEAEDDTEEKAQDTEDDEDRSHSQLF